MDHYNEPIKPSRPAREIVQIASTRSEMYALCNDGTTWRQNVHGIWYQLPSIPQPEGPK
jgi:hypothetical protein